VVKSDQVSSYFQLSGDSEGIFFPCSRTSLIYKYGTRETAGDRLKVTESLSKHI
jgi:hypothetical protein